MDIKDINEEDLFSDGYWIGCGSEEELDKLLEEGEGEDYTPRYPIDLAHPVTLTEGQKEHARILLEALDKYFDENPEDGGMAPLLRISQNWEVMITRGGFMNDSDFVDPILCVMCHGEKGYYLDPDYVAQCVPFIEEELKEIAECVGPEDAPIASFREQEVDRVTKLEMDMISLLSSIDPRYGYDRILIAIDKVIPEVYAWPIEEKAEEYGGLIKYFRADTLISRDGKIDVDRVKAIIRDTLKSR